jgi:SAM-dependent methyltransferase
MPNDFTLSDFLKLMGGHAVVRSIGVAAELGVPDALVSGPRSARELAQICGADPEALGRVLRMLAAIGVFTESSAGAGSQGMASGSVGPAGDNEAPRDAVAIRYGLTPISQLLRSDIPGSLRDFARLRGGSMSWKAWAGLEHSVRTGESGFALAHGSGAFEHLREHPADAKVFDNGVRSLTQPIHTAIVESYDFSRFRRVIDVGGGQGGLLAAILRANPRLEGILLDTANVVANSGEVLRSAGVAERCEIVAGDFFEPLPRRADAAILSHVLHNWSDEDSLRILRNCREAVGPRGVVLILEYGLSDDAAGLIAKQFDLQMLVYFGQGKERTTAEYRQLLARAGLTLTRVVQTPAVVAVFEASAS